MIDRAYWRINENLFARVEPERAHSVALRTLAAAWKMPGGRRLLRRGLPEQDERLRLRVWGLPFANPLGVAAGLDKDGVAVEPLIELGFRHVEVGTVTLLPQPGNKQPRVWRVPEARAVINALGFPSEGAAKVRERLMPLRPNGVVGVNIGKGYATPLEDAAGDYTALVTTFFEAAQYFTVNVSSPNTPGLRSLQLAGQLGDLLAAVQEANRCTGRLLNWEPRPVLVKFAPDLIDEDIERIAVAAAEAGADGIVGVNTTTERIGISPGYSDLPGGLSGPPLKQRANHVARVLYRAVDGRIPIIGVGGIASGADVIERMRAGATLVQLYTAFIYGGPMLPGKILREMSAIADAEGWSSIREVIGADAG